MSKISEAFKDTKAFIPFITGGDPSLEITEQLLYAMEEAGADIIEIGIPFSDPIAEGPVIQAANERALAAGCTTDKLFKTVKKARKKVQVPMVFLTYLNPIYTYGKERFMERCRECGIQGVIVPDMPFEEKGELKEVCKEYGIEIISLIAPTSNERIAAIAKEAEGYIYCVSSLGVTGVREQISTDIKGMVDKARIGTGGLHSSRHYKVNVGFHDSQIQNRKSYSIVAHLSFLLTLPFSNLYNLYNPF